MKDFFALSLKHLLQAQTEHTELGGLLACGTETSAFMSSNWKQTAFVLFLVL